MLLSEEKKTLLPQKKVGLMKCMMIYLYGS
jgi:hypothetical protein